MLFIIGGASRSGKTILAKKLVVGYGASWFSADFLSSAFELAAPHLHVPGARDGVPDGKDFILCAQRQWPFISELIKSISASKTNYILEGEVLIPSLVSTLEIEVVPCFLGYDSADTATKLAEISTYSDSSANDWTRAYSTQEQLCIIDERIKFSAQIAAQAHEHGMPYFDLSRNFVATMEQAYEALVSRAGRTRQ